MQPWVCADILRKRSIERERENRFLTFEFPSLTPLTFLSGNILIPGPSLELPQLTNTTQQPLPSDFFVYYQFNETMDGPNLTNAMRYEAGGWPRNEWAERQVRKR